MSTEYWIIRVNYSQKVCYVILGDVPVFKAIKIVSEIRSYFEINNIDISAFLFHVSFDVYQMWLQLLNLEDLIAMISSHGSVLDDIRLSSVKHHITSIKYELEIEPNATIRTYNYATPETIFNEWFNDVSPSDKRKEKEMSDNTVSPSLSKIEKRIEQLNQLEHDNNSIELKIQQHKNALEKLSFEHDELSMDIANVHDRIHHLCDQAIIGEGFTREYIRRFLKERGYQQ